MGTHPSATSVEAATPSAEKDYLQDIFLKVREQDRLTRADRARLDALIGPTKEGRFTGRVLQPREQLALSDELTAYENAISELLALVAPFALRRAREAAAIAPQYQQGIVDLHGMQVDLYVRPIFEDAGIAERYIGWDEARSSSSEAA